MTQRDRGRAKFGMRTLHQDLFRNDDHRLNERAHEQQHEPLIITYTSTSTLSTTAGSKLRMPGAGEIVRVQARVQTAPSSTFQLDLLLDGTSVFESGTYLEIASGETVSKYIIPRGRIYFNDTTDLKFKVQTIAAAVGPYVATIEYLPGW